MHVQQNIKIFYLLFIRSSSEGDRERTGTRTRSSAKNLKVFMYHKNRNYCGKRPVSVYNSLESFTMQITSNPLDSNSKV